MHFHSIPNYAGSDSEQADSEQVDSEQADSEQVDSEQADSEQADSGFPSMSMMSWDSSLTESTRLNRTFRQLNVSELTVVIQNSVSR